jgi:hypothetical protein
MKWKWTFQWRLSHWSCFGLWVTRDFDAAHVVQPTSRPIAAVATPFATSSTSRVRCQAFQPGTLRFHQCDRGRFRDAFRHTSLNHDSRFRHSGYYVAAHDVQILVHDEARPDQAAVAEHERGQSDDPRHARLVGEHHLELGKVDLRLMVRRRRKADLGRTSRRKLVTAV